jgi:cobalamin transport system permease protein
MTAVAAERRTKQCSLCGRRFGCADGEPGCWCEQVVVSPAMLAELRDLATDCLCPACLSDVAERDQGPVRAGRSAKAIPHAAVRARGVPAAWGIASAGVLVAALLVGLGVGPISISVWHIAQSALAHVPFSHVHSPLNTADSAIVWQLRAPRVVLAALVGGTLAISGSAYQGVFRNPLADPYLLGVAAGAGLGATAAIGYASAASRSGALLPIAAFAGAAAAVAATYALGRSVGGARSTGTLILAGVTVAAFFTAVETFVQQQHSDTLLQVYSWLLGGFGSSTWHDVAIVLPYVAVSSTVLLMHRRVLDVLSLGDEEAAALGLNVRRTRLVIVVAATLGTAAVVAVSGLIGFVGIIVPHTVRLLVSTSYRAIVPLALLLGGAFLVLADVVARTVMSPAELPIGVVTAFFGAPFFALVLRSTRNVDA